MVQIKDRRYIEVYSEMNEWMHCVFAVDEKDQERAVEVLIEAYDSFWDEETDDCYGDFLESAMRNAGIECEVFYASIGE